MTQATLDCLVGKYFHTTKKCVHGYDVLAGLMGRVIAALPNNYLLIETLEWWLGSPQGQERSWGQELIAFSEFISRHPVFYEDSEDMKFSYDHGRVSHKCQRLKTETAERDTNR